MKQNTLIIHYHNPQDITWYTTGDKLHNGKFSDIPKQYKDYYTIALIPTTDLLIKQISLPKLSNKLLKKALPNALEDQLLDNNNDYIVLNYQNNLYDIAIINKLQIYKTNADEVIPDIFLLPEEKSYIEINNIIVARTGKYSGFSIEKQSFKHYSALNRKLVLNKSKKNYSDLLRNFTNLLNINLITPCHKNQKTKWQTSILLATACLVSFGIGQIAYAIKLKHQKNYYQQQINQIYFQLFPHAQQLINPKFRIQQLISNNDHKDNKDFFKKILLISSLFQPQDIQPEEIYYQNNQINISFKIENFSKLEKLEKKLKKHYRINKKSSIQKENYILARWLIT